MNNFMMSVLGGALGVIIGVSALALTVMIIRAIHKVRNSREHTILKIERYCKRHNKPIPKELSERTLKSLQEINKTIRTKS